MNEREENQISRRDFLTGNSDQSVGRVREYWIKAESFETDSVPNKRNEFLGIDIVGATNYIGLRYLAYSENWGKPIPASKEIGENIGLPGPVIRANVGDTIIVHFKNADEFYKQPHSIHAHGVSYSQEFSGVWAADRTDLKGVAVKFGESFTYRWTTDKTSVGAWSYHDNSRPFSVAKPNDTTIGANEWIGKILGLMGFIIVTDPIVEKSKPQPDKEFFLVVHDLSSDDIPSLKITPSGAINGRSFLGNTPNFQAKVGERVRWYIIGNNAVGAPRLVYFPHDFHVTGHRWIYRNRYQSTAFLEPDSVRVLEWIEDNAGKWLYRSHSIRDTGMYGWYVVN